LVLSWASVLNAYIYAYGITCSLHTRPVWVHSPETSEWSQERSGSHLWSAKLQGRQGTWAKHTIHTHPYGTGHGYRTRTHSSYMFALV